jgi:hypothetical protein
MPIVHAAARLRALAAAGLAGALLAVAACGGSTASGVAGSGTPAATIGSGGGAALPPGLQSNLDGLDSYRFVETLAAVSTGKSAAPVSSAGPALSIVGTVVNAGTKSLWINDAGAQLIVIGDRAWSSLDGTTWYTADPKDASFDGLLPGAEYATWFDSRAASFKAVGEETRNGVLCVRYKGDDSLGGVTASGSASLFRADLWISKSGNFPVSGVFGITDASGAISGGSGYSFDVTHPNAPANKVGVPANVIALPS